MDITELSMHGLDWVGSRFSVFGGLGWVHYSKSTKKFETIMLMHLKHGYGRSDRYRKPISSVYKNTSLLNCKLHC